MNLEKAYDRVNREVLWRCLEKKGASAAYIRVMWDMYKGVRVKVRTMGGYKGLFYSYWTSQGSKPFLFTTIMDELIRGIQD